MSFGLAHAAMLAALAAMALPPLIHLLNRRRVPTVDWGAMMFLDAGRRARTRFRLAEWLLMLARMALLGLVALAAARPFLRPPAAAATTAAAPSQGRRDIVLILDGSAAMGRRGPDGWSPADRALAYARRLVRSLRAGDSAAILVAADRVRPLVDPPRSDRGLLIQSLAEVPRPTGSADLPGALAEAFRILETTRNPARSIVVLTDGRRASWRPDQAERRRLLRALHGRLSVRPALHVVRFEPAADADAADAGIGPIELSRGLVAPGATIEVRAAVTNEGPAPLTRTVELVRDGRPEAGATVTIGPLPSGSQAPVVFRVRLVEPGAHALAIRLTPDPADPLVSNDESACAVEVVEALPVLLVDGEPGREPLSGEVDFLRAALAPRDDETPQFLATTIGLDLLSSESLSAARVAVLANVDRLTSAQATAVGSFLDNGGGVLFIPGDRSDADAANAAIYREGRGWLPARLGDWRGDFSKREVIARPDPATFTGVVGTLAGGEAPPLGRAGLFAYRALVPAAGEPSTTILARLDNGDPWLIERPNRGGIVAMTAGPLDAEGGTLPVNPDFVPLVHELILHLADPSPRTAPVASGQPLIFELAEPPLDGVESLPVTTPGGREVAAEVERRGGGVVARLDDAGEPGLYRLALPDPPGGSAFGVVLPDPAATDPTPLSTADVEHLTEGWPLEFTGPGDPSLLLAGGPASGMPRGPRPLWRGLVLAALAGLCVELFLTRRMARGIS